MFSVRNLQINRGITTANCQGNFTTVIHTYKDTTSTVAIIKAYLPPYLGQGAEQDFLKVGDHLLILGSDTSNFCEILSLSPFTVSTDLFSGASGLSIGAPITAIDQNGAVITGETLQLENADGTHPGIVSTATQTFGGQKTFANGILTNNIDPIALSGTLALGAVNGGIVDFTTLQVNNFMSGNSNIPIGAFSIQANGGFNNIGIGQNTLQANSTGGNNIAIGTDALFLNTAGSFNVGIGSGTLLSNVNGTFNVGIGSSTLGANTSGQQNVAIGSNALSTNSTANNNIAVGSNSLQDNRTGQQNVAIGVNALLHNLTGNSNIAIGNGALIANTSAIDNIGIGESTLQANTTGTNNIAIGFDSSQNFTTGSSNIIIGSSGGSAYTTSESNNILLGGGTGTVGESGAIRIGTASQTTNFQAGISGVTVAGGVSVIVGATGQLGTVVSLRRRKENIKEIPEKENSEIISQLEPVKFDYISSHAKYQQYGLIAEDVEKISPELCVYDIKDNLQSVYYDKIVIMLLKEVQRLQKEIEILKAK